VATALITATTLLYAKPGDLCQTYHSAIHPGHLGPLSLAIPSWVGTISIGDGFSQRWGRNGEFCVAVGPVTWTAGILA